MAIKHFKPVHNGRRFTSGINYREILTTNKPYRKLTKPLVPKSGRNNTGQITVRHRGAGHKRKYRIIDFKRSVRDVLGRVATIEYDPNRNAFISLINYRNGVKKYILHCQKLTVGMDIICSAFAETQVGNCLQLQNIPEGTLIHNLEIHPGHGGQIARSAGSYARVLAHEEHQKYTLVRLKSGETRRVLKTCYATIGAVSNVEYNLVKYGKAGRNRWKGKRPTVRGAAMNPADHPHGGGNGKAPVGGKHPRTPWGKPALGLKTRKKRRYSNYLIVKRRTVK